MSVNSHPFLAHHSRMLKQNLGKAVVSSPDSSYAVCLLSTLSQNISSEASGPFGQKLSYICSILGLRDYSFVLFSSAIFEENVEILS